MIIDFRQNISHEFYGGDGFPDVAIATDDPENVKVAITPSYPNNRYWHTILISMSLLGD